MDKSARVAKPTVKCKAYNTSAIRRLAPGRQRAWLQMFLIKDSHGRIFVQITAAARASAVTLLP